MKTGFFFGYFFLTSRSEWQALSEDFQQVCDIIHAKHIFYRGPVMFIATCYSKCGDQESNLEGSISSDSGVQSSLEGVSY